VLSGDSRGSRLAILLGRGLKAWLDVLGSLDAPSFAPPALIAAETGRLKPVPGQYRTQLTAVMAGMVLHSWQQGRHA
jgi:hypothetical protein